MHSKEGAEVLRRLNTCFMQAYQETINGKTASFYNGKMAAFEEAMGILKECIK